MMKTVTLILFFALFLVACEKETHITYFLKNNTSERVYINTQSLIYNMEISDTLEVNQVKSIISWVKRGKEDEFMDPSVMFGDSISARTESGSDLKPGALTINRWSADIENNRAVVLHKYTLTLIDEDFQSD